MTNAKKIKLALAYAGISESELARRLNTSPQAFNQRMKTDKFTCAEMERIGSAIGAEYSSRFTFPDGTDI